MFTLHRYRIETELAAQLVITKYTQYYRINEEDLSNYDLIISSVPIRKQLSIPVINTSYMITNDDIIRIKSYLSYLFNDEDLVYYFHPYLYSSNVKVKRDVYKRQILLVQFLSIKDSRPSFHNKLTLLH